MDNKPSLRHAINKWQNNCESNTIDVGWNSCQLCVGFIHDECMGCPINYWNFPYCNNSPYYAVRQMVTNCIIDKLPIDPCVREVLFLQNILSLEEYHNDTL